MSGSSAQQNKLHYDVLYDNIRVDGHLHFLRNRDKRFREQVRTHISWHGFYWNGFEQELKGKTVLELGAGNGLNAAVMASFGATVLVNDISTKTGEILEKLNASYPFEQPIMFVGDDFLSADIPEASIDFVVGKAFVHHLDHNLEELFFKKIMRVLKPKGHARFFEPAVNSRILDELRWATPVPGRPSKWFQPKAFKRWEQVDPHPKRDNSSKHYKNLGDKYFKETQVIPLGVFDRLYRIVPLKGASKNAFRRSMLSWEPNIPLWIRQKGARSQLVLYKFPR